MLSLTQILSENTRRMAELHRDYDPVRGDSSDPMRVKVKSPDGEFYYVPVDMLSMHKESEFPDMSPQEFDELRCLHDFPYWAATRCYIKRKGGGEDVLFRLNAPQRKLVRELEKMRRGDKPIRLILLKARQWGGSTCAQIYMSWLQLIQKPGLNSLIVAHQHAATYEIRDMFIRMIERYVFKFKVEPCTKNIEHAGPGTIRVKEGNFKVKVASAERPDSCRGGDYSLVHCSEVALWKKTRLRTPEDMLRAACSGVLLKPLTMILLESTANGADNFFHTEYTSAMRGESQFTPLFIAWYEIEQYSLPFKDGEKEKFAERLLKFKDQEQTLGEREQPGAYLWWLWERGATLEAINWYVNERKKFSDHGMMASEYPSDDVEAFVHSGASVFDKYKVEALRPPCKKNAIIGEIYGCGSMGKDSLQDVKFAEDATGMLKMWNDREKEPGIRVADRYLVVVDIGGRSAAADWSVIAVFDRGPMIIGNPPEIVAQWRGHTDFDLLAWKAAAIAKYYYAALLVIESNTLETHDRDRNVEGDQSYYLLNQIRECYENLYARRQTPDDIRAGKSVKYGFHTNMATKPMIISNLVRVVREGMYVERDEMCLNEYLSYEQRENGSYGAVSGKHDDLLMTRAIGLYICFNEMELPRREMECERVTYKRQNLNSTAYF